MNVTIIGQGYVCLPLAIAAAGVGHRVVGIDSNQARVEKLKEGRSPIGDLSDAQISQVINSGCYKVSDNFESVGKCDVIIVCVPTPLDSAYNPDLSFLSAALTSIASKLQAGSLVIIESTVAPGTTRTLVADLL